MKKLRAFDTHDKIMYKVFGIRSDSARGDRILINHKNGFLWFFVDPYFRIMESTNLKDKNEREIYVSDIIDGLPVEYHNSYFALKKENTSGISWTGLTYFEDMIVTGNIYENADLLKK